MSVPTECIACHEPATVKDYRERNQIVDGYPVCGKHFGFDDGNFWKAVKRKEIQSKGIPCANMRDLDKIMEGE